MPALTASIADAEPDTPTATDGRGTHPVSQPHAMACMEIWGGNVAASTAVSTPGIDAFVYSRPYHSHEGGGDIHYVSLCSAGKIGRFVVADVAGHGAEVAGIAQRLRSLMRRHINAVDQARFARALNEAFSRGDTSSGRFATAILATYWAPTDHLVVCNAGHPRPLWYKARERRWVLMDEEGALPAGARDTGIRNLPLGVIDPTDYTQAAYKLDPGDIVVLYTDSIIEAKAPGGELLGEEGLLGVARSLDPSRPDEFVPRLLDAAGRHRAGAEADDDVTILVLHHNAAEPPAYSLGEKVATLGRMLGLSAV